MIVIIRKKTSEEELKEMAEDFGGYIKVVVDLKRKILAGGGKRHVDAEQLLLKDSSKQKDLWGGGFDLESKEIDYNSMINIRSAQKNMSREIMSQAVRKEFDKIVKNLLI